MNDVLLNVIGASIGIAFFSPKLKMLDRRLVVLIRIAVMMSLLIVYRNAIIYAYDGYQSHIQFPVLFDLSSPFEMTRWRGQWVRYESSEYENAKVLHADFLPAKYPTLIFDHFPRDWSGYKHIEIVAYNPVHDDVSLYIRIHDFAHFEKTSHYGDRYNNKLRLKPGWNTLKIDLEDIRLAPRDREMDMRRIHQLMLFFPNLSSPKTLLIREIRLAND